ncbi:pyruvate kinase [Helicosporidium sp. ATCC 50920]|nr:pyruvate kinase [Helicosporidium sp. ATCC 50920]|eukprot:KDD76665.1 pyruvate kinase [Helicosporidium sp. ATCC 50920]
MFDASERWAIYLSTLAGLSTTLGGLIAVVRRPDDAMLAFLLGTAIGVMLVLSVMEMWVHNAMEHGWYGSTISFLAGTLIYQLVQPLLPDGDPRPASATPLAAKVPNSPVATVRSQRRATTRTEGSMLKHSRAAAVQADSTDPAPIDVGLSPSPPESPSPPPQSVPARSRELLRLGALMAATMTMHNLPEGVAVAFSSFTPVGPIMAAAVAVHNIPEGVIVAAPIYAATGSRWRALAWATASGLSEPIGALCALLFIRPWVSPATVHGALGVVGGVMAAVCVLELWPEARKCRSDRRLAAGCVVGAVAMFWTLLDNPSRRALQTLKLRYHSYFAAPDEEQSTQQRYRNRAATIMVGAEDSGRGAGADGLPTATQYGGNKTKVICTLGPACESVETLKEMLHAGMNVARFNFSHGTHEYHQRLLNNLRQACEETHIMCAVMLDTKGPEIRTGFLKDDKDVLLEAKEKVTLTTDYEVRGNSSLIPVSYPRLAHDLEPDKLVLIADGSISLRVLSCDPDKGTVECEVVNTAKLGTRKNVNLPGVITDLPTLTDKDVTDLLEWGVPNEIDLIAASFVRRASDLATIRRVLGQAGAYIKIISKVENHEGVQNFDEVLAASDAVMVARGDLGMEIPTEKIFLAQKLMIQKCNLAGKPVVTATQMLESMTKASRPTRAEATDVANAVLDGTDCVMLSGETASGAYPVDAVKVMTKICREAEASIDHGSLFRAIMKRIPLPMSPLESLASSAVRTAHKVRAAVIVVMTRGGATARLVAKYRPTMPILTVVVPVLTTDNLTWKCSSESPARQALISRGLLPILAEGSARTSDSDTTDEILQAALEHAKAEHYCARGDTVVALHRIGNASVIKLIDIK